MHYKKGIVTSAKGDKTVIVAVTTNKMHPKYGKYYKVTKKFYAHDEENRNKEGDEVTIKSVKPISKMKRWLCVPDDAIERLKKAEGEKQEKKEAQKKEMVDKMIAKMKKEGLGEPKKRKQAEKKVEKKEEEKKEAPKKEEKKEEPKKEEKKPEEKKEEVKEEVKKEK